MSEPTVVFEAVPSTDGISDPLPSDWKAAGMAEMKASVLALLEGGGDECP